jgi:hypothetical protein
MSEVMQEHLQKLMSQGFMTAAELATFLVPKDPASPAPAGRIRHGVCGILRVRIWCTTTLISLLSTIVLQLVAASLDSLGDLAYGDLRDPV